MTVAESFAAAFPPNLWVLYVVCAVLSAVGFYKFVYFLSIGYGFAVSGVGVALLLLFLGKATPGIWIQCVLFIVYGIRLGGFLLVREIKSKSYRKTLAEASKTGKPIPLFVQIFIWIFVSALYVMQTSPVYYRLVNGAAEGAMPFVGAAIMAFGLGLETVSDLQKSAAKKVDASRFCDSGLFKLVRCPNYLGEITFWTGVFVSGFGALTGVFQWVVAAVGYLAIVYIMFSGAKRLETRQTKNYGARADYQEYVKKTPILLPFVPLYSLLRWDFIKI